MTEPELTSQPIGGGRGSAPRLQPRARSKLPLPLRFRRPLATPNHLRAPDRHRSRAAHRFLHRRRPSPSTRGCRWHLRLCELPRDHHRSRSSRAWRDLDLVRRSLRSRSLQPRPHQPRRHSCAPCKPPHPPPTVTSQVNRRRSAIEIVVAQNRGRFAVGRHEELIAILPQL